MQFNEYRENRDSITVGQKLYFISGVLDFQGVPFDEFWEKKGLPLVLENGYQSTDELLDMLLKEAAPQRPEEFMFAPEDNDNPIPPPNIPAGQGPQPQQPSNAAGNVMGWMTGMKLPGMMGQGWNNVVDWGAKQMGYDPQNASMAQKGLMGLAKAPGYLAQLPQMGLNKLGQHMSQPGGFTDQMADMAGRAAGKFADQYNNYQGGRPAFVNALKSGGRTTAGPQVEPEAYPQPEEEGGGVMGVANDAMNRMSAPGPMSDQGVDVPVQSGSGVPATPQNQPANTQVQGPNMQTLQKFNQALGDINQAIANSNHPNAQQVSQQLAQAAQGAQKLLSSPAPQSAPQPSQTPAIRGMHKR